MKDDKAEVTHLESHVVPGENDAALEMEELAVMGTVRLTDGDIVYVPTPSADPQGRMMERTRTCTIVR